MTDKYVRFGGPGTYILNMLVFLVGVGAIVFYMSPLSPQPNDLLVTAFMANPALNGLILVVLLAGIAYSLGQAGAVSPSVRWVNSFRESVDPARTRLPRAPGLIGAMVRMLLDADKRGGRLTQASSRAILDSIGTRMDESREIGRYIANLLVFLGLLGTFWGLLQTVNAVAATISGLATTGGSAQNAVAQLIQGLQEPLSGMGTAFSSSLFGLGGSLVVGYLDIQSGRAHNRFYSDLEDWLSGITQTVTASDQGGQRIMSAEGSEDVVGVLHNIEAALKVLTQNQDAAQARASEEVRAEIRALGRTLVEGTPPPTGPSGKRS